MKTAQLLNYERDRWIAGDGSLVEIVSAIDGAPVALTGSGGVDFGAMLRHAREVGGPALRKLTFHERARMVKALGLAIMARKEELYELNYLTGATRKDGWIDIEGGAGTLFSFSSKGRRELPDAHVLLDGQIEPLSKQGTFVGQHIYTSLQGAAVHINAFNFPVWGMLEKLAPTLGREGEERAGAALDVDPAVLARRSGLIVELVQLLLARHDREAERLHHPRPLVKRQLAQRRPADLAGVAQHAAEIESARPRGRHRRAVDCACDLDR